MKSGISKANQNKAVRREALNDYLAAMGNIQHVIDICEELNNLAVEMDGVAVQRKKTVIDTKLKLINKYLPDVKSVSPMVEFEFPKDAKPHIQASHVLYAMSKGLIQSDIGNVFIQSIKSMIDIEEYTDLKERIERIEKSLGVSSE